MLPAAARLRRSEDFREVMKRGSRAGRRRLVVHARVAPSPSASSTRAGFVVSKAVGNSVVRHRVSRRLRHLVAARLGTVPPGSALVIRALPPAATASSAELGADLDTALRRLGLLPDRRTAGSGQDDKDGPAV
ncbi:ribonuclease P protein component [Amycolatopsis bartoniae]|uniref:Ribonuclease P protein component n=1 Tax=Amycolatopsis bartoniae TaxID=941986 RepID=A0A8H9IYK7_9PSEU|nr:ribonuclease P protein component [Amycolatopsis bartoniae]TVT11788.1 ribonuclease P protein component [Amycolatopsis bartoniae]GHF57990.1 ribonuclease P protein component [Amycolatopsis bartoniae]